MFDRARNIAKRWDALPVGPWRVDEAGGRYVVRDAQGRILAEAADRGVAETIAQSYEDVAFLAGEVRRLRRELSERDEGSGDFVGKVHNGRVTLATYRVDVDPDAQGGSGGDGKPR